MDQEIEIMVADERHIDYVEVILDTIEKAAKVRGTGIAKRDLNMLRRKFVKGKP